jgi:CDP-diacylglycerol--inositol 3-phosphatidyltransferase
MVFKQVVNVIQLIKACQWLAEGDAKARKAAGLPRRRSLKNKSN